MTDNPNAFSGGKLSPSQDEKASLRSADPFTISLPSGLEKQFKKELDALGLENVEPSRQRILKDGEPAFITYSFPADLLDEKKRALKDLSNKYGLHHQRTLTEILDRKEALRIAPNLSKTTVNHSRDYTEHFAVSFLEAGVSDVVDVQRLKFEEALVDFFSDREKKLIDLPDLAHHVTVKTEGGKTSFYFHLTVHVPANTLPARAIEREYGANFSKIKDMARKYSGKIYTDYSANGQHVQANYIQ